MQIKVRTHHVDITPALKAYAEKKMAKLEKYFKNIVEINVELDIVDHADPAKRQSAKAHILASQATLYAEGISDDMYASIDILLEKLEAQIIKHKEKLKDHKNDRLTKQLIHEGLEPATPEISES
jgi:putative sigma-54 modulation protein